ncbi:MAG TPA: thiolase family protein [Ignavibacteriaceae bacterium]|nr:thiolase family protein [Ignavibacteriaceae bacterium]
MKKVVITHAKRTPIGSFNGVLSGFSAPQLGSFVIKDLIESSGISTGLVDEVIMGNVLASGLGQAPARQAAIFAGLATNTEALTINKMCGSGLKAVMLAQQAILSGDAEIIIAGGQESMTNAPYILQKARNGYKLGNSTLYDSILLDGLTDAYDNVHMGTCAEATAKEFSFLRNELDEFAILSYKRAIEAQKLNLFNDELTPIKISSKQGETIIDYDEEPSRVNFDKIPTLKPVFDKNGVVTAANASSINDGASALLIMSEEKAIELGLTPIAEIIAQASAAKEPVQFTTAPADAITKLLKKVNLPIDAIGLFEINEAFAVVSLAVNKILGLTSENVNIKGGAVALGHPIGASGARILTTLLHSMKQKDVEYGVASLCIGGGEASAILVKSYKK